MAESASTSFSSLPPICSAAMASFWYSCGEVPAAIEASLIWAAALAADVAIAKNAAGTAVKAAVDLSTVALTDGSAPVTPSPNSRTLPNAPENAVPTPWTARPTRAPTLTAATSRCWVVWTTLPN